MAKARKALVAESTIATIINAAASVFAAEGMQATMDVVARHAGVTRRTIYRAFPDRRALIEAVAIRRLDDVLKKVRPSIAAQKTLPDALVTGFVEFIRRARADQVFIGALEVASDWRMERFLVGPHEAFVTRAETLWQPAIERALASGEWRTTLDRRQVNGWLRSVAVILLLRDDLDRRGQEQLVRSFVVPAFAVEPPDKRRQAARARRQ